MENRRIVNNKIGMYRFEVRNSTGTPQAVSLRKAKGLNAPDIAFAIGKFFIFWVEIWNQLHHLKVYELK